MTFCHSCQSFNLHAFSTAPDKTRSYRLLAVERAARENCLLCSFFLLHLQKSIIEFPVDPDKCWVRMVTPTSQERSNSRTPALQLSELEIYLADSALVTIAGKRTDGVFLNLAADPSMSAL